MGGARNAGRLRARAPSFFTTRREAGIVQSFPFRTLSPIIKEPMP